MTKTEVRSQQNVGHFWFLSLINSDLEFVSDFEIRASNF